MVVSTVSLVLQKPHVSNGFAKWRSFKELLGKQATSTTAFHPSFFLTSRGFGAAAPAKAKRRPERELGREGWRQQSRFEARTLFRSKTAVHPSELQLVLIKAKPRWKAEAILGRTPSSTMGLLTGSKLTPSNDSTLSRMFAPTHPPTQKNRRNTPSIQPHKATGNRRGKHKGVSASDKTPPEIGRLQAPGIQTHLTKMVGFVRPAVGVSSLTEPLLVGFKGETKGHTIMCVFVGRGSLAGPRGF